MHSLINKNTFVSITNTTTNLRNIKIFGRLYMGFHNMHRQLTISVLNFNSPPNLTLSVFFKLL